VFAYATAGAVKLDWIVRPGAIAGAGVRPIDWRRMRREEHEAITGRR